MMKRSMTMLPQPLCPVILGLHGGDILLGDTLTTCLDPLLVP